MKLAKPILTSITALFVVSTPASAHEGEHASSAIINAFHWLSSPSHALFSLVVTIAILGTAYKLLRKSRV